MNLADVSEIFEIVMIVCFGFSWPFNVIKSIKSRTAKGKSLLFLILILVGYIFGIISKFIRPDFVSWFVGDGSYSHGHWYVLIAYFFNLIVVSIDFSLYWRNRHLDKLREQEGDSING